MLTLHFNMGPSIQVWQWPNILAIDAALIAVLWQLALARVLNIEIGWAASGVLGLSVWLTYVADRLYDVGSREKVLLFSLRHQFATRYSQTLWHVWFVLLAMNLLLARQLTAMQVKNGSLLLIFCLLYTVLNQKLSRRFFPKEICVALIYAGGVIIFLPVAYPIGFFGLFTLLCLLNCLMIGAREKVIDAKMQVHSVAALVGEYWLAPLALIGAGLTIWRGDELWLGLAISFGLLGLLHGLRKRISLEAFRVLADTVLVVGALSALGLESRL
jgi:hypothetical protein